MAKCAVCPKPAVAQCSGCHETPYCGRECQVQDWPQHRAACQGGAQSKKVVLVTGATGMQGGAVARALLKDGTFRVRVLVRSAEKGSALKALGAEVVVGDTMDFGSSKAALEGVHGVFLVSTNNLLEPAYEAASVKAFLDAAKEIGTVQHVFFSGYEYERAAMVRVVPLLDSKGEICRYIRSLGLPATFGMLFSYFEMNFAKPGKEADGTLVYSVTAETADTAIPFTSLDDFGAVAVAVFRNRAEWLGQSFLVGEFLTPNQIVATASEVYQRPAKWSGTTPAAMAAQGWPGAGHIADMFYVLGSGEFQAKYGDTVRAGWAKLGCLRTLKEYMGTVQVD